MTGRGNVDKLTKLEKAFYTELTNCINAKSKDEQVLPYTIDVYHGNADVLIGNYKNNSIDVADIDQFNNIGEGGVTKQGKLIHEIVEQGKKAFYGNKKGDSMGRDLSHKYGCTSESKVNGLRRDIKGDKKTQRGVFIEHHYDNKKEYTITIRDLPIIEVSQ